MEREPVESAKQRPRLSGSSRLWLGFTLLLFVVGLATALLPGRPPPAQHITAPAFDLQGHRGARGLMPENTLPAFEAALALGVTTLELDTVVTADGVVVVHHDRRLAPERTRNAAGDWLGDDGTPAILLLTFEQLGAFDVGRAKPGSRYAGRWPEQAGLDGVAIPTLAKVLARAEALSGGAVRYNIETKVAADSPTDSADPAAFAKALIAVIREAGVSERAAVQSFDWRTLQAVQQEAPGIETVYLTAEQDWLDTLQRDGPIPSPWLGGLAIDWTQTTLPQAIHSAGGAVWSPYYRDLREVDLREAQRLGLRVVVWTVNDAASMASLIDLGVDGLITDYPDRAREVMAEKGLSLPNAFPGE